MDRGVEIAGSEVAPVRAERVARAARAVGELLDGEDEDAAGTERVRRRRCDGLERAEVDERVG